MAVKRIVSKKVASKAARILKDPNATKRAKSAAGSTLSQRFSTVKSSAKTGKISRSTARKAVKNARKVKK